MNILILNGSPRARGETAGMIEVFQQAAEARGHSVRRFDVCRMNVRGCLACEYCHGKGQGVCVQKDDMQQISEALQNTELLVLASPIYYHGISGQLKCVIDRFYAPLYPKAPESLKKVAMLLASGDPEMYEGAKFSYDGDFLDYLHLEGCGIFTNHDPEVRQKLRALAESLNIEG